MFDRCHLLTVPKYFLRDETFWSLLLTFCSLLVSFCSLFISFCLLLIAVACYFLLVARYFFSHCSLLFTCYLIFLNATEKLYYENSGSALNLSSSFVLPWSWIPPVNLAFTFKIISSVAVFFGFAICVIIYHFQKLALWISIKMWVLYVIVLWE